MVAIWIVGAGLGVDVGRGELVGLGVGSPGLEDGGFSSSTVVPGRMRRTQPGLMLSGSYLADVGSRVG
jgi:hypothetical protein